MSAARASASPSTLRATFGEDAAALGEGLARVEARLLAVAEAARGPVRGHARWTLDAGGKRLRPLLVLACGRSGASVIGGALVHAAASVELVHSATLVHDDLLDGAALRRGRRTVAHLAGPGAAVATGDHLFAAAFGELARAESVEAVAVLADAAVALARGELAQQRQAFDLDLGEAAYLARCDLKTGSLFAAACALGACLGGRSAPEIRELAAYGTQLGRAFQIFDDVLDLAGRSEDTGKGVGTDLRDGTMTLPIILGVRHPLVRALVETRPRTDADVDAAIAAIESTGALAESRAAARRAVAAAKAHLGAAVDDDPADHPLARIADGVVDRYS